MSEDPYSPDFSCVECDNVADGEWHVRGRLVFQIGDDPNQDAVYEGEDGMLHYDFVILSDHEPDSADIQAAIGKVSVRLLPMHVNGRLTRTSGL